MSGRVSGVMLKNSSLVLGAFALCLTNAAAQDRSADDHLWFAEMYCADRPQPDDASCRRTLMGCVHEPGQEPGECPTFADCRYYVHGTLVSQDRCATMARVNAFGVRVGYWWRNGNRMGTFHSATDEVPSEWNGQPAVTVRVGGRSCLSLAASGEVFCSH